MLYYLIYLKKVFTYVGAWSDKIWKGYVKLKFNAHTADKVNDFYRENLP